MQRLHEDDLVGHVLEQEQWEVVSFPAIAEQDETFPIETPYGRAALHAAPRAGCCTRRASRAGPSRAFAARSASTISPVSTSRRRRLRGGGMVREGVVQNLRIRRPPDSFEQIVQSWDTANKATELNRYSVCTPGA